jgi:FxsC-like protein
MREELVPDSAENAPYFFLSYAHSQWNDGGDFPEVDPWVKQLFEDLCYQVKSLIGAPFDAPVGFMSHESLTGPDLSAALQHALATCRVFVPLYSPRYFELDQCGREWSAFARRLPSRDAFPPSAIIPASWTPVDPESLPGAARAIPCDHAGVQAYADLGFWGIMKLSRYRADYEKAVQHLAGRIKDAVVGSTIADGRVLDYSRLESAFETPGWEMPGGRPLRITIAAPSMGDLPKGRGTYYYGTVARDWAPYRPESPRALADYLSDLARALGYRPIVGDLQEHGAELLNGERPSAPELLIVDPWASRQDKVRELLMRLDAMDKPWVQVVVPWNRRDAETAMAESELREGLEEALHRKLAQGRVASVLAVRGVPALDDLARVLPVVITTAVRQYHRHAPARLPAGDVVERPRLSVSR